MKDFFVSYTNADVQWAEWIAWTLEQEGYATTIQAWDFRPGSNFVLEMQRALLECERVIAVLSPRYLASKFAAEEWSAAIASDPTGDKLVPIRIEPCDNEGLLRARVYIDLVGADEATARQRLLAGVQRERAKPATAPAFPTSAPRRFPGTPPAIWNIPFPRNPHFTGRDDELRELHNALAAGQATALTQPQTIHGLGGVGKTHLAVEYAYRFAAEYDLVWWVRADAPLSIATDLALLAAPLQLPQRDERDQRVVVQAVLDYLRGSEKSFAPTPRWLIIFDNAEDPRDLRPFLPQGRGSILITSRNPNWGALARPLEVQTLPRDKAIEFLLARTGLPCPSKMGEGGGEGAGELADALGCLPLALEQAAAYIEASGISFADYLARWRTHHRKLLQHPPATDYPATVATTWDISFQAVAAQSPASVTLLNLLAFFAPEPIPREVVLVGIERATKDEGLKTEDEGRTTNELRSTQYALDQAVIPLRRYSLIQTTPETLAMHRLVQMIVRDRLDDDARKTFAHAALHAVNDAFPGDEILTSIESWATCARLAAHARAVTEEAERLGIVPEATARLLNQLGVYLRSRAEFAGAHTCYERALKIYEATFGPNHPEVATAVNNLGGVLRDLGDLAGARACFERALQIDEATFGPNHPNVAIRVNNLGSVLRDLGDLAGARVCYERAFQIDEATFGPNHPNVARDVNNLGLVLRDLGDLAGARACFERALNILTQFLPADHPHIKIVRGNLEGLQRTKGEKPGF